jgi:hypothetical protein
MPIEHRPRPLLARAALALIHAWHLLSLDAPTVAALWAFAFARAFRLSLSPFALPLLFAGTWLLYIADRILDGLRHNPARLRERHLFYMRHRLAVTAIAVPVGAVLAWLVFFHMLPAARRADALIFSVVAAYFALVHLCGPEIERWFPKELIVALVFASATAVPALVRITSIAVPDPSQDKFILLLMSALFAALCWLNCVAIEKWEQPAHPSRGRLQILPPNPTASDRTARWGQRHLRRLSFLLAFVSVLAGASLLPYNPQATALCIAASASALLLLALDRARLSSFHLRIAADAALLTPLLALFLR